MQLTQLTPRGGGGGLFTSGVATPVTSSDARRRFPQPGALLLTTTTTSTRYLQPLRILASSFLRLRDHTKARTTVGRTPLDEWSVRRRDLYLTNTQHSQQTNINAYGGIRTRNPSRRAAADPRLRPLGHSDRHYYYYYFYYYYYYY
jgi:hypothetical protein